MSLLNNIQNDVQKAAEVIAAALRVDVEILDDEFRTVGATGRAQKWLMKIYDCSYVTEHVLSTAKPYILENPGQNKLCQECADQNKCLYTYGVYYPIMYNNCIGVISLVAFDEAQREMLIANSKNYLEFIGRMSDLLSTKVSESKAYEEILRSKQYLKAIIDSVQEGIISIDEAAKVRYFNRAAENILGYKSRDVVGKEVNDVLAGNLAYKSMLDGTPYEEEEMEYQVGDGSKIVLSTATPIMVGDALVGAVESFTDINKIYRYTYKISNRETESAFNEIIGNSASIEKVKAQAQKVAQSSSTVLITGSSGTGKELIARAIHRSSKRAGQSFVAINCGAIPQNLIESELFGYEKGAFTGADTRGKVGKIELAHKGTLFLDEIGDMPSHLQVKLLRVLQEKTFEKVGGNNSISVDIRIIAATNQNLEELVNDGQFREDLYYRLKVIPLHLPALNERIDDVPALTEYLSNKYCKTANKKIIGFSSEAMEVLMAYPWPGNVRELENAIEFAVNFCPEKELITEEMLPDWVTEVADGKSLNLNIRDKMMTDEKRIINNYLNTYGNTLEAKKQIAEDLGISLTSLYRRLRKYQLLIKHKS